MFCVQRTFTDLNSLNHNPAYNLATSQPQPNGTITTYAPMSQSNGSATLQRPMPPPPPSREGTLSRAPGDTLPAHRSHMETLQSRPSTGGVEGGGNNTTSPPGKPSEETNGVALVSQQELDFNSKGGHKERSKCWNWLKHFF